MKNKVLLFILLNCCFINAALAQEPYRLIMTRIKDDLLASVKKNQLTQKVSDYLALLDRDGRWNDLDYTDLYYAPISRIKEMAIAYTNPGDSLYKNEELYIAIVKSLENWSFITSKNKNWWYEDIYYPQATGEILILMRFADKQLPVELQGKLIQKMLIKNFRKDNGANTSDEALHFMYRACLIENKPLLDSAVKYLFSSIEIVNDKDGAVQPDNSYYQHGKQQAIASYGRVFVSNALNAAYYLRGTKYALPADKLNILINYTKNTFAKSIRGKYYDFSVRGRGLTRKDSMLANLQNIPDKLKAINPANAVYWDALKQRTTGQKTASFNVEPSNSYYWKCNYALHVRPGYTFSVQTSSDRTFNTERGNTENLFGNFLCDGATNIQRSGSEYSNLMPVWEWDKIPGTTCRDYKNDEGAAAIKKDWGEYGTTKFCGGVSDGKYGVSTYYLNHDSVTAKKAWFFFDKEIVCMGSAISSSANENITTTINQSKLNTSILLADNKGEIKVLDSNAVTQFRNPRWILQDSIGYFFTTGENINASNQQQQGSWYHINNLQPKDSVKENVFKLWIDHGAKPKDGSYQYIVVPGINNSQQMNKYDISSIKIIQNTNAIQAVQHNGLNMLQVVFYEAGSLLFNGTSITVDKPCVLYIKNTKSLHSVFYIADPTQELSKISVTTQWAKTKKSKTINCTMPVKGMAGSTVSFTLAN